MAGIGDMPMGPLTYRGEPIKPSDLKNPMKLKHLGTAVPDIE